MKSEPTEIWKLSPPGYACELGPKISKVGSVVEVEYDSEADDGSRCWTTISFQGATAFRFTPESGCDEFQVSAYDCIAISPDSDWIAALRKEYESVQHNMSTECRHYLVFFDHHGCVEVIAAGYSIPD